MLNSDGTVLSRISLTISLQLGCHLLTDALMTFGMVTVVSPMLDLSCAVLIMFLSSSSSGATRNVVWWPKREIF
jgi:hypothetical protein